MLHKKKLLFTLLLTPCLALAHTHQGYRTVEDQGQEVDRLQYHLHQLRAHNTHLQNNLYKLGQKIAGTMRKNTPSTLSKITSWTLKTLGCLIGLLFLTALSFWRYDPAAFFANINRWFAIDLKSWLEETEEEDTQHSHKQGSQGGSRQQETQEHQRHSILQEPSFEYIQQKASEVKEMILSSHNHTKEGLVSTINSYLSNHNSLQGQSQHKFFQNLLQHFTSTSRYIQVRDACHDIIKDQLKKSILSAYLLVKNKPPQELEQIIQKVFDLNACLQAFDIENKHLIIHKVLSSFNKNEEGSLKKIIYTISQKQALLYANQKHTTEYIQALQKMDTHQSDPQNISLEKRVEKELFDMHFASSIWDKSSVLKNMAAQLQFTNPNITKHLNNKARIHENHYTEFVNTIDPYIDNHWNDYTDDLINNFIRNLNEKEKNIWNKVILLRSIITYSSKKWSREDACEKDEEKKESIMKICDRIKESIDKHFKKFEGILQQEYQSMSKQESNQEESNQEDDNKEESNQEESNQEDDNKEESNQEDDNTKIEKLVDKIVYSYNENPREIIFDIAYLVASSMNSFCGGVYNKEEKNIIESIKKIRKCIQKKKGKYDPLNIATKMFLQNKKQDIQDKKIMKTCIEDIKKKILYAKKDKTTNKTTDDICKATTTYLCKSDFFKIRNKHCILKVIAEHIRSESPRLHRHLEGKAGIFCGFFYTISRKIDECIHKSTKNGLRILIQNDNSTSQVQSSSKTNTPDVDVIDGLEKNVIDALKKDVIDALEKEIKEEENRKKENRKKIDDWDKRILLKSLMVHAQCRRDLLPNNRVYKQNNQYKESTKENFEKEKEMYNEIYNTLNGWAVKHNLWEDNDKNVRS